MAVTIPKLQSPLGDSLASPPKLGPPLANLPNAEELLTTPKVPRKKRPTAMTPSSVASATTIGTPPVRTAPPPPPGSSSHTSDVSRILFPTGEARRQAKKPPAGGPARAASRLGLTTVKRQPPASNVGTVPAPGNVALGGAWHAQEQVRCLGVPTGACVACRSPRGTVP